MAMQWYTVVLDFCGQLFCNFCKFPNFWHKILTVAEYRTGYFKITKKQIWCDHKNKRPRKFGVQRITSINYLLKFFYSLNYIYSLHTTLKIK